MIPTKQLRPHRFLTLRLFLYNLCGLLLAVLLLNNTANSTTVDPNLLFLSDFETGNIQTRKANPDGWTEQSCYDYSFEPVTSPVRAGNYAMKIFLRKSDEYECMGYVGDETYHRAKAQINKAQPSEMLLQEKEGRWLGFSVFIPNNWPNTGNTAEIGYIFEWVSNLYYYLRDDGTEEVKVRWNPDYGSLPIDHEVLWLEPYVKNEWVDWVFYYYPALDSSGVVKVWRNGTLVGSRNGINCMKSHIGPYGWSPASFKLYKPQWKITPTSYTELTIYYDEIRMAIGPDTQEYYNLVAPPPRSPQVPVPTNVKVLPENR